MSDAEHIRARYSRYEAYGVRLLAFGVLGVSFSRIFPGTPSLVVGSAAVLLAGCALLVRRWPARAILALVIYGLLTLLSWWRAYEAIYGPLSYDDFLAIYQADAKEAIWFVGSILPPQPTTFLILAVLAFFIIGHPMPSAPDQRTRSSRTRVARTLGASVMVAVSSAILVFQLHHGFGARWDRFISSARDFRAQIAEQNISASHGGAAQAPRPAALRGNIILVVGESTARRHMSLYGYYRPTTPVLDSLRDELLVQADTVSPHSHTDMTVPPLFGIDWARSLLRQFPGGLVGALRSSGVKTFWYSNQNEFGIWENPVTLIAKSADVWQFQKRGFERKSDAEIYDGGLVPRLAEALRDPARAKFVTLHFYAPHWDYCKVFPRTSGDLSKADGLGQKFFGRAKDLSDDVNCYDNAIRYVDGVVGQIIGLARDAKEPTAVIFVSDHGENPASGTNHDSALHSAYQVEIPLVWYFNHAGQDVWKEQVGNLKSHLGEPFLSADLDHSLLQLAGADPALFDASRSLLSPSFRTEPRRLFENNPEKFVSYDTLDPDRKDYLEITRNALKQLRESRPADWEKTWAHRVNSLGKLMETKDIFAGVEIDLVFNVSKGTFFVYHPPAADIGLSLEEYLKAASSQPGLRIWCDWKNASPELFHAALTELLRLDRQFNLKRRIVVESSDDQVFPDLRELRQQGFFHSYYLPTDEIVTCAEHGPSARCEELAESIDHNATLVGADAISFDALGSRFVQAHAALFSRFKLLTWDLDSNSATRDFAAKLPPLDRLSVFLTVFPSSFDY